MSSIQEMIDSLQTVDELKAFIEAQHATIMELTKNNDQLKEKVKKLEITIPTQNNNQYIPVINPDEPLPEETICRIELRKLHTLSEERALTYEEAKKVDLYAKLIMNLQQKPKNVTIDTKKKDTADLLKLVAGGSDNE